jgi:hypothetical protein
MKSDFVQRAAVTGVLAALLVGLAGCAGPVEVTRTFTPTAASRVDADTLHPVAIVREGVSFPVPAGSRVEADQIVRRDGKTLALQSTDGVVMHGIVAPDESIPGGGRVESSRRSGVLAAGVIVMVLAYAPTAYIGATSASDRTLLVPVAGPWIDLGRRPGCVEPQTTVPLPVDPCIADKAARAALVTSGSLQGLAALMTFVGLPSTARVVEGDRGVAVVPTAGGAAVIGRF